jgi:excisionase family DNA binding protein
VDATRTEQFRILTVAQVAERLGVSIQVVYRMIYRGDLQTLRVGRGRRIREADLLDWLSAASEAVSESSPM